MQIRFTMVVILLHSYEVIGLRPAQKFMGAKDAGKGTSRILNI